jgi:adenine-specific DNA-methyltransferase
MARELLADTGSIFVQISDENLHRVRCVMDEVFGPTNAVAVITFVKTSAQEDNLLSGVCDYLLWYAKDISKVKYRQTWVEKTASDAGTSEYNRVELQDRVRRKMADEEEESWSLLPES